jgi:16S rRNA U516 pseudouridylate synthase RsuA-like enzyme
MLIRRIPVFVDTEPYIIGVIVQAVTRAGQYIDRSQAQHLTGKGLVKLDGAVIKQFDASVTEGCHQLNVNGKIYNINVAAMPYQ